MDRKTKKSANCVAIDTKSLSEYVSKSKEQALCAVTIEGVLKTNDAAVIDKTAFQERRRERVVAKPLHGQFLRATEEDRDDRT